LGTLLKPNQCLVESRKGIQDREVIAGVRQFVVYDPNFDWPRTLAFRTGLGIRQLLKLISFRSFGFHSFSCAFGVELRTSGTQILQPGGVLPTIEVNLQMPSLSATVSA
jgi:hypothetical protein